MKMAEKNRKWAEKSGFDKTKDEVFELMMAEAGLKPEQNARQSEKNSAKSEKDEKWNGKSGFDKTKDQIAELMILESSKFIKKGSEETNFADPSEDVNLIRARGTAFMAEQARMQRQHEGDADHISRKYEDKEFTDTKTARDMCFGAVESPLETQARHATVKKVKRESMEALRFHKTETAYLGLGKFDLLDIKDQEKLDLEVSKALHAEVHFKNLGYQVDIN